MTGTLMTQANSVPRRLAAITIALLFAVLVAQPVGASKDDEMEISAQGGAAACTSVGGEATIDYNFNADGSLASIQTTCAGGKDDGVTCTYWPDDFQCTHPFTRTPQTPVQSVRPQTGTVGGVFEEQP